MAQRMFTISSIAYTKAVFDIIRYSYPRIYPSIDVVVEFALSYDPECCAGGSVATGRVSHVLQIKDDDPHKK
jgi:hypothetical protein